MRVIDGGVIWAGDDVEDVVGADDEVEGFFADGGVEALRGLGDDDGGWVGMDWPGTCAWAKETVRESERQRRA